MSRTNYRKCFLACPLGKRGGKLRKQANFVLKKLLDPAIEKLGYKGSFVKSTESVITWEVISDTVNCDLFAADLTDGNPNVLYELALAHTIRKPTITLVDDSQIAKLPFDVNQLHTIPYNYKLKKGMPNKSEINKTQREIYRRVKNLLKNPHEQVTPISIFLDTVNPVELVIKALPPDNQAIHIVHAINFVSKNLASNKVSKKTVVVKEPELHCAHDDICKHAYGAARMRLVNDFADYCRECSEMVKRATGSKTNIITVQTSVKIDLHRRYKVAYEGYIAATNRQIVTFPQPKYRRLYIVTENISVTKKMALDFLRKLVRAAIRNETTSLDNVWLGFVRLDRALDHVFNNVDFHITSDKEFSVAFVPPALRGEFGESIHILDIEKHLSKEMAELARNMWNRAEQKLNLTAHYYSQNQNYNDIMNKLYNCMDRIIKNIN